MSAKHALLLQLMMAALLWQLRLLARKAQHPPIQVMPGQLSARAVASNATGATRFGVSLALLENSKMVAAPAVVQAAFASGFDVPLDDVCGRKGFTLMLRPADLGGTHCDQLSAAAPQDAFTAAGACELYAFFPRSELEGVAAAFQACDAGCFTGKIQPLVLDPSREERCPLPAVRQTPGCCTLIRTVQGHYQHRPPMDWATHLQS